MLFRKSNKLQRKSRIKPKNMKSKTNMTGLHDF